VVKSEEMLSRRRRTWRLFEYALLAAIVLPLAVLVTALARGAFGLAGAMVISVLFFVANYVTIRGISRKSGRSADDC
jgi:hypothetical protein